MISKVMFGCSRQDFREQVASLKDKMLCSLFVSKDVLGSALKRCGLLEYKLVGMLQILLELAQ